jgi:hypothetical protein
MVLTGIRVGYAIFVLATVALLILAVGAPYDMGG